MMKIYNVYPVGDDFVITQGGEDIRIKVSGAEGIPVTEEEVKEILDKGKHEFKFDHDKKKVREMTKAEKKARDLRISQQTDTMNPDTIPNTKKIQ